MSDTQAPDGMISIFDYCAIYGEKPETVIKKIRSGGYVGQKVQNDWYIKPVDSQEEKTEQPKPSRAKAKKPKTITCKQCDGEMAKGSKVEKNMGLQVLGVLLFFFAVFLLFIFPIGTIAGVVLMIVATTLGYGKKHGWKCRNCGYFFETS